MKVNKKNHIGIKKRSYSTYKTIQIGEVKNGALINTTRTEKN